MGDLHHREEGGVGGGEDVEEEDAGAQHHQEHQPGAPLRRLVLGAMRGKYKVEN